MPRFLPQQAVNEDQGRVRARDAAALVEEVVDGREAQEKVHGPSISSRVTSTRRPITWAR